MEEGIRAAKAVVKTIRILECLAQEQSLGVTELAKRAGLVAGGAGMNKSTVFRFLHSLKTLGYVRQDADTGHYSLTLRLFEMGMAVHDRLELWRQAQSVIREIAEATGETVHLATMDGDSLVYVDKIESRRTLRVSMASRVGKSIPTYCTALGKTLLAHFSRDRVTALLKKEKMVRLTPRTITTRPEMDRELAAIRRAGYAIDNEEHEVGVRCVAAPVRDSGGTVIAAVSISVPTVRLGEGAIPRYGETVMQAARTISGRLGYRPGTERPAARGKPPSRAARNTRRTQGKRGD
jgi:IclR family KDG regulon transcriptional repressor